MPQKSALLANCLLMLGGIHSKIVTNSPLWEEDWYDENTNIGVNNGEPYSKDREFERFIKAPLTLEGDDSDFMTQNNVQRVLRVFPGDNFEEMFPFRNQMYTYDGFLRAIGKYPAFCG